MRFKATLNGGEVTLQVRVGESLVHEAPHATAFGAGRVRTLFVNEGGELYRRVERWGWDEYGATYTQREATCPVDRLRARTALCTGPWAWIDGGAERTWQESPGWPAWERI